MGRQIDGKWKYRTWNAEPEVLLGFCMVLTLLLTLFHSGYTDLPPLTLQAGSLCAGEMLSMLFPQLCQDIIRAMPQLQFLSTPNPVINDSALKLQLWWMPSHKHACILKTGLQQVPNSQKIQLWFTVCNPVCTSQSSLESSGKLYNWRIAASQCEGLERPPHYITLLELTSKLQKPKTVGGTVETSFADYPLPTPRASQGVYRDEGRSSCPWTKV